MSSQPLATFPVEVLESILAFCDGATLNVVSATSKRLGCICAPNGHVWQRAVELLWQGKVHIPPRAVTLRTSGKHREAYWFSLRDATRCIITPEELCRTWTLRYLPTMGPDWPVDVTRQIFIDRSGELIRLDTDSWDGFPWTLSQHQTRPISVVRFTAFQRCLPRKYVRRHSNWGWIMESVWTQYTSFPMDLSDPELANIDPEVNGIGVVDAFLWKLGGPTPDSFPEAQQHFVAAVLAQLQAQQPQPGQPSMQTVSVDIALRVDQRFV